ncbi:uncharacterized protein LOC141647685 [Silene latifolia]|uniref:uncharacterized protein LOC141647685 n=1 Tax=Silene latifolia TaxID=37657 RepID=UPI003D773C43
MELKHGIVALLIVYFFVAPYAFSVRARELAEVVSDEDVYEIDYRGPETHSHLPPPKKLGGAPYIHDQTVKFQKDGRLPANKFPRNGN